MNTRVGLRWRVLSALQRLINKVMSTAATMCRQDRLWQMLWHRSDGSLPMSVTTSPTVNDVQRGLTVPDTEMNASSAGYVVARFDEISGASTQGKDACDCHGNCMCACVCMATDRYLIVYCLRDCCPQQAI